MQDFKVAACAGDNRCSFEEAYKLVSFELAQLKEKLAPGLTSPQNVQKKVEIINKSGGLDSILQNRQWYDHYKSMREEYKISARECLRLKEEIEILKEAFNSKYPSIHGMPLLLTLEDLRQLGLGKFIDCDSINPEDIFPTIEIHKNTFYYREDIIKFIECHASESLFKL